MSTNPYFSSQSVAYTQDQALFNNLIVEAIQAKGLDHYYLPRTLRNFDQFFGEDQASAFNDALQIEMFMESVEQWGGDGSFLGKFGLEIRDSAKLIVSQSRFEEVVTSEYPEITRPREGDIIAFPSPIDRRMRFFEISFVNNEATFYQIGKLYTYELTVKNFEYTGESFGTGVEELDSFELDYSQTMSVNLFSRTGNFVVGETVDQGPSFSGEIIDIPSANTLTLIKVKGVFDYYSVLAGRISGATALPTQEIPIPVTPEFMEDAPIIDTSTKQNGLVDFSEYNPLTGS
jgi:hypothetical protein